jgi:arginyl-tRNA--protein-N-Asp/Glu arginylyltransferase
MWIAFIIALAIIAFGVANCDKMSYKANYERNKKNNTGYYWGGRPRDNWGKK